MNALLVLLQTSIVKQVLAIPLACTLTFGVRSSVQDTSGVSRDELALALMEVSEGRIPKDRIALRELTREMREWPFADISNDSRGPAISAGACAELP